MTKKDYIAFAKVLKKYNDCLEPCAKDITKDIAALFANDNPRFNQDKFLEACGVKQ